MRNCTNKGTSRKLKLVKETKYVTKMPQIIQTHRKTGTSQYCVAFNVIGLISLVRYLRSPLSVCLQSSAKPYKVFCH